MRALRPPDPYKNKGVRYTGEKLRKKVGKTGAGGKASKELPPWHKNQRRENPRSNSYAHPPQGGRHHARPRLAVFRSLKHITVQIIDDSQGHTLVAASSSEKKTGASAATFPERRKSQADCRPGEGKRYQGGRVRSRRVPLSWPRQGLGRTPRAKRASSSRSTGNLMATTTQKRIDLGSTELERAGCVDQSRHPRSSRAART